jgi:hypothetical protein
MRPELKNIRDLRRDDFVRHPVWINCHCVDYDEEWYDDTTEETMRPYLGQTPVGTDELYSVRCSLEFADGTMFDGFATPAEEPEEWGVIQPRLLLPDRPPVMFWCGAYPRNGMLSDFCGIVGKKTEQIFPIRVAPISGLTTGRCSGIVRGFMKWTQDSYEIVGD